MHLPEFITPASAAAARAIQDTLRPQLRIVDDYPKLELIAGVDVGYDVVRNLAHASIVTMHVDELKPIEQVRAYVPAAFPYIPGLLAFREIPALLAALAKLQEVPDVLMVDGHGIAHPKRMGIAAHLGLICDMPSLGVGKSRLTGKFETPGPHKGDVTPLISGRECIGMVLRSRDNVAPLFISPGHRMSMESALALTKRCLVKYRLPEPTRIADKFSKCTDKA
jgi:deoxyribonuclease V